MLAEGCVTPLWESDHLEDSFFSADDGRALEGDSIERIARKEAIATHLFGTFLKTGLLGYSAPASAENDARNLRLYSAKYLNGLKDVSQDSYHGYGASIVPEQWARKFDESVSEILDVAQFGATTTGNSRAVEIAGAFSESAIRGNGFGPDGPGGLSLVVRDVPPLLTSHSQGPPTSKLGSRSNHTSPLTKDPSQHSQPRQTILQFPSAKSRPTFATLSKQSSSSSSFYNNDSMASTQFGDLDDELEQIVMTVSRA